MKRLQILAAVVVVSGSLLGMGQTVPATQPKVAAGELQKLVGELGAGDFGVREAAQKKLKQVPAAQRDEVAGLMEKATDPEVKDRLQAVVQWMDECIALDPPGISLDVKEATATQVMEKLNKAVGGSFVVPAFDTDVFTLRAENRPFWEVMKELSDQHALWPGTPDGRAMVQTPFVRTQVDRGVLVGVRDVRVMPNSMVRATVVAAIDPRVVVLALSPVEVAAAHDDQGHELAVQPDSTVNAARLRVQSANGATRFMQRDVQFKAADGLGKSMSFQGKITLTAQVAETSVTIADAGKHVNEPTAVGESKVTLGEMMHGAAGVKRVGLLVQIMPKDAAGDTPAVPNVEITDNGFSMRGGLSSSGGTLVFDNEGSTGGIFMGVAANGPKAHVVVTDGKGKKVADYSVPAARPTTSVHVISDDYQEPLKYVISLPTRTVDAVVPFEFKDVPVGP